MGAEEVFGMTDEHKKEQCIEEIQKMYKNTKRMIREDAGVVEIDNLFKRITKSQLSSPIIDSIRYFRAHPEKIHRK